MDKAQEYNASKQSNDIIVPISRQPQIGHGDQLWMVKTRKESKRLFVLLSLSLALAECDHGSAQGALSFFGGCGTVNT
jgi:hypothetical protein